MPNDLKEKKRAIYLQILFCAQDLLFVIVRDMKVWCTFAHNIHIFSKLVT